MSRPRRGNRAHVITGGVAGSLALLTVGAGGGAIATVRISSAQIADNSIRSRDVRDGSLLIRDLAPAARAALPAGPPGPTGEAGARGPDGVTQVVALLGPVGTVAPFSGSYVFAGQAVQVTTTATHSRVTSTATASLGLNVGAPQFADIGMCFQPVTGGALTDFNGNNFTTSFFTTTRATYTSSATKVLPPATYNVGMCVRNNGANPINNNNYASGWVMVTS